MSNPKPDLHNINAYIKFDENTLRFTPDQFNPIHYDKFQ